MVLGQPINGSTKEKCDEIMCYLAGLEKAQKAVRASSAPSDGGGNARSKVYKGDSAEKMFERGKEWFQKSKC